MLKALAGLILLGLLVPLPAYQQDGNVPFVQCGDSTGNQGNPLSCTLDNLLAVPVRIYNFLLGLAGLIALGMIIWAGTRMLLFHLSESPEGELSNAKLTLTRAVFGLLIIAGAYLIVNFLLYTALGLSPGSGLRVLLQTFNL